MCPYDQFDEHGGYLPAEPDVHVLRLGVEAGPRAEVGNRWPRSKPCLADHGKHRWRYSPARLSRTCRKCGTTQFRAT